MAVIVVICGLAWVLWNTTGNFWTTAVFSLQPPLPDGVELTRTDVIAQRSMAAAAWWMVMLTTISIGVGTLGLYLVARTLREAKRSADAAHDAVDATMLIGKKQVRAYLDIEEATAKIDRYMLTLSVDASLTNSGQSPARSINGTAVLSFLEFYSLPEGEMGTDVLVELSTKFSASAVSAGKSADMFLTFAMFGVKPSLTEIFNGFAQRAVQIDVSLEYTDVFDDTWTENRSLGAFVSTVGKTQDGFALRVSSSDK